MAEVEVTLSDGLPVKDMNTGEETRQIHCTIRSLDVGIMVDAELASEKLYWVPGQAGEAIVQSSPTLAGVHTVARRIVKIGSVPGPLSLEQVRKLSRRDWLAINAKCDELDRAEARTLKPGELSDRGRAAAAGGNN